MVYGKKRTKTGILGGTFNPVHNGHIHLAENALQAAGLDQILFVPSGISYMKDQHEILPAKERVELVRLAIQDHPRFLLSTIETDRECNSYTHETILTMQTKHRDTEFFFLTGADTIFSILCFAVLNALSTACSVVAAEIPFAGTSRPFVAA